MYSDKVNEHTALGAKAYAAKEYEAAAASYSDACAAFHEETGTDNADLLLLYGKALFQHAVAQSLVLGGAAQPTDPVDGAELKEEDAEEQGLEKGFEGQDEAPAHEEEESEAESADEGELQPEAGNDDEAAEPSAFEEAWEILDLARALFEQQTESDADKPSEPYLGADDAEPTTPYVDSVRKLSETYDLLGEVSLETENFPQAAADLAACLALRQKLYDAKLSALVSESHYKLSLALEFCLEDTDLRAKAAKQMEHAIAIVKAREAQLPPKDGSLLPELQERHAELSKAPAVSEQQQQVDIIKGILGEAVASSDLASSSQLPVNDLSAMVKKRKAPARPATKRSKPE